MRPIITLSLSTLLACNAATPAPGISDTTNATDTTTTTTTVTDSTTTDSPTTLDTPEPDVSSSIRCDLWAQDCTPGRKCVPYASGSSDVWDATRCAPLTGDAAPDEPCTAPDGEYTGNDDCMAGALCLDLDPDGHGVCRAMCNGKPDGPACPANSTCRINEYDSIFFCLTACDPRLPSCPAGQVCTPDEDRFRCTIDASGADGQADDACTVANGCDPGLICLNIAASSAACDQGFNGCCQPFCTVPDGPCPNPDQQCVQWYDPMQPIPDGLEALGVCAIPT